VSIRFPSIAQALLCGFGTGCLTFSDGRLAEIAPAPPATAPTIEQTVGDFTFELEGGEMVTDNKAGRMLNDEILSRWKDAGYIADHRYVPTSQFSGGAPYNLTLSGSQYGASSIVMQILSGATLLILPYSVDSQYDVQYTVENVKTGEKYSAGVEEGYTTWVELLLFLAAPFSLRGADQTFDRMADHLYEQLRSQGAFEAPAAASD
jgi:hypothetical protein